MRAKDVVIGKTYRHRTSSIGYAQPVAILPPRTGINTTAGTLVKCAWASEPSFQVFMFKHFKPSDLKDPS